MAPASLLVCLLLLGATGALEGVPKILLGTGGGGGGFSAPLWLSAGGQGFNTALSYCYQQFTPQCSHVAIASALAAAGGGAANASFIATKVEPEDFGPTALLTGPSRVLDRDVLAEMNLRSVGALMWHQAGRAAAAGNYRPPCFNASAAGPSGPGAYAACRVQGYGAFLDAQRMGAVRYAGVSNYEIRDLQQLYDAFGVWPQVLEIEVHPYYHPDALIDFACVALGGAQGAARCAASRPSPRPTPTSRLPYLPSPAQAFQGHLHL